MGKGQVTRQRILDEALGVASRDGLAGLTIGSLATALGLSKSGLFAHFGSKEALQGAVLRHAGERFTRHLGAYVDGREGTARVQALLEAWLDWIDDPALPGGCPVMAACFELDDQEGDPRRVLLEMQERMRAALVAFLQDHVQDPAQGAFDFLGIVLAYHHASRVLRDPGARERARRGLARLLDGGPA